MKKFILAAALALGCTIAAPVSAHHWATGGNRWNPDVVPGGYYDHWRYYDPSVVIVPATLPCFPLLPCGSNPAKTRIVYIKGVAYADCGYGHLVRPGASCGQPVQTAVTEPASGEVANGSVIRDTPADGCTDSEYKGKIVFICPK